MRRLGIAAATLVVAFGAGGTAAYLLTDSATADSLVDCGNSRSEALLSNRIVAPSQSYRKDNPTEYVKVRAYLDGGARPAGVTTHMGFHLLYGEDVCRAQTPPTTTTDTTTTTTTTTPPPPPPTGCTQTISSGLTAAIQGAAAGTVICLNSGSYGNVSLTNLSKASDVTVQPASGASPVVGLIALNNVNHLRFTGLKINGLQVDTASGTSNHLTFDHAVWTAGALVYARGANQAILLDYGVFDNLGPFGYEGRVSIRGFNNSSAVGVTVSNSHFGGGCSDGIQLVGQANGVVVGPGNEFTGITQSGCDPVHADPIQCVGTTNAVITGNYFHSNGSGSGGILCGLDNLETVTNNVFSCTCGYPWSIFVGGGDNWQIRHNTFKGGGAVRFEVFVNNTPSGNLVRDNVFTSGGINTSVSGYGTNDHNLNAGQSGSGNLTGTPVFVGGANPTTYAGHRLAAGSPGKSAASDGTDMGIP